MVLKNILSVVFVGLLCFGPLDVFCSSAAAQSGGRNRRPARNQPFEVTFWNWLQRTNYRQWEHPAGQTGDFYEGQAPHGALLKTYVNRRAADDQQNWQPGSVIVKENYNEDKQLMAITVMMRTENFDPQHGNWWWAKYRPSGQIDRSPADQGDKKLVGRVQGCINCHSGAEGEDYSFLNDTP